MKYERVFQILKYKIESGLLPVGSKLPSRINLQQEFNTSEKTIRRALAMLEENGLIQTHQRKRPVVSPNQNWEHRLKQLAMKKIDTAITDDLVRTGVLLCYPVIKNGIILCKQEDFKIPREILNNLKVENAREFWRQTKRFLRFFVARNENELALSIVDSLGLEELRPSVDAIEIRKGFYGQLNEFMEMIERREPPEIAYFDDPSGLYQFAYGKRFVFDAPSDSTLVNGELQLENLLNGAEVRYSAVYMDLLGLIAVGRYQPGDKLPSHIELQKIYNVSVDTTNKAIQIMQEWGIVKAVRGNGIFVEMELTEMKKIQIPGYLIAYHVRRYLDSLELLVLTIEEAAACAALHITPEEIQKIKTKIEYLWNENYLYPRTPALLLDLITEHIEIAAFRSIYILLRQIFRIGRSIPALLHTDKTTDDTEIHQQCIESIDMLLCGEQETFSEKTSKIFKNIYHLLIQDCMRLGYYETAMEVYDGGELWR